MKTQNFFYKKVITFVKLVLTSSLILSCEAVTMKGAKGEVESSAFIQEFKIISPVEASGKIIETAIEVYVPSGTDQTAMKASLILGSETSTVNPDPAEPKDYTSPQKFTVRGADGAETEYIVTVIVSENDEKEIVGFKVKTSDGTEVDGKIKGTSIMLVVPQGTDLSALNASAQYKGKLIQPDPRDIHDFTAVQKFTVYAEDTSSIEYRVEAIMGADILAFWIKAPVEAQGKIDRENKEIEVNLPAGTSLAALEAEVTLSEGTINPDPAEPKDYSNRDITYTVSSDYAESITYKVYASLMEPGKYTVIYDPNGGTGSQVSEIWNIGEANILKADRTFTKTGYTFSGWKDLDKDQVYGAGESKLDLADEGATITLYAQWIPNSYTITYDGNGGSGSMQSVKHVYGEAKKLSTNVFKYDNHLFNGWADAYDAQKKYADEENVLNLTAENNAAIRLNAQWLASYTVRYDSNGGSGDMPDDTHIIGLGSYTIAANSFTRSDTKVFAGWNTNKDGSGSKYKAGVVQTPLTTKAGDTVTLYAQWDSFSFTVKYDLNGASAGPKSGSSFNEQFVNSVWMLPYVKDLLALDLSPPPNLPEFTGWSDSKNGQKKMDDGAILLLNKNGLDKVKTLFPNLQTGDVLTMYAIWRGPYPSGSVTLSRKSAIVGSPVNAVIGTISNAQGSPVYTWFAGDQVVASGVTSYTPKAADVGKEIKIRLGYTNGDLESEKTTPVVEVMQLKQQHPVTNGYIFYINPNSAKDGWTYLEAADNDSVMGNVKNRYPELGGKLPFLDYKAKVWTVYPPEIYASGSGAYNTGLGGGKELTQAFYSTSYFVTQIVYDDALHFTADGKTGYEWYVPNIAELTEMYNVLKKNNIGSIGNTGYWASNLLYGGMTHWMEMTNGKVSTGDISLSQTQHNRLRPIRRY